MVGTFHGHLRVVQVDGRDSAGDVGLAQVFTHGLDLGCVLRKHHRRVQGLVGRIHIAQRHQAVTHVQIADLDRSAILHHAGVVGRHHLDRAPVLGFEGQRTAGYCGHLTQHAAHAGVLAPASGVLWASLAGPRRRATTCSRKVPGVRGAEA